MSLVRRAGGLTYRAVTHFTRDRLSPGSGIPFDLFLRTQVRLLKRDAYRRFAFPLEMALLDRFLAARGVVAPAAVEAAHWERAFACLLLRTRRYYSTLPATKLRRWLPLADEVAPAIQHGAFLLGVHVGGGVLTTMALSQVGSPLFAVIRAPSGTLRPRGVEVCNLADTLPHDAVIRTLARLRSGGAVFLAPDGGAGQAANDVQVEVLGRQRMMSRGFAELALSSGLRPQPVFSQIEDSGQVRTWLEPPLELPSGPRSAAAETLVRAYADVISAFFVRHPGSLSHVTMKRYLGEHINRAPAKERSAAPAPRSSVRP